MTDERLDDFRRYVEVRFDHIDSELRELRVEISGQRVELGREIGSLRGEFDAFRLTMIRLTAGFGGGIILALLGVIGAVLQSG